LQGFYPPPFSFISTIANTPLFFLLQHLDAANSGISCGHSHFAFESALMLSIADFKVGECERALVGVVDTYSESGARIGNWGERHEFSAWMLLDFDERDEVCIYDDFDGLTERLDGVDEILISPNFTAEERANLAKCAKTQISAAPLLISNQSASDICAHISSPKRPFIYAGRDPRGGYSFIRLH
jgi:hypothetical protein